MMVRFCAYICVCVVHHSGMQCVLLFTLTCTRSASSILSIFVLFLFSFFNLFFSFYLPSSVIFLCGIEDPQAEAIAELAEFEK